MNYKLAMGIFWLHISLFWSFEVTSIAALTFTLGAEQPWDCKDIPLHLFDTLCSVSLIFFFFPEMLFWIIFIYFYATWRLKTKRHVNVCISWTAPPEDDFAFLARLIWFIITGSLRAENSLIFYKEQTKWTWCKFIKETFQFVYVIIIFSQRKLLALMKIADFNKDSQFTLKSARLWLEANFFGLNVVKFLCFKSGWLLNTNAEKYQQWHCS